MHYSGEERVRGKNEVMSTGLGRLLGMLFFAQRVVVLLGGSYRFIAFPSCCFDFHGFVGGGGGFFV